MGYVRYRTYRTVCVCACPCVCVYVRVRSCVCLRASECTRACTCMGCLAFATLCDEVHECVYLPKHLSEIIHVGLGIM